MPSPSLTIVALSGGVDSAVAALLLRDAGHAVQCLHMSNWEDDGYCDNARDFHDARSVCQQLGLALHRVQDALVGLDAGEGFVEGLSGDACRGRLAAQLLHAGVEIGSWGRLRDRYDKEDREKCGTGNHHERQWMRAAPAWRRTNTAQDLRDGINWRPGEAGKVLGRAMTLWRQAHGSEHIALSSSGPRDPSLPSVRVRSFPAAV